MNFNPWSFIIYSGEADPCKNHNLLGNFERGLWWRLGITDEHQTSNRTGWVAAASRNLWTAGFYLEISREGFVWGDYVVRIIG